MIREGVRSTNEGGNPLWLNMLTRGRRGEVRAYLVARSLNGPSRLTPMPTSAPRADDADRLHVLDVLRGIALLGMFLVHFSMFSSGGTRVDQAYQAGVALLLEERFWAIFAMLFGVGNANIERVPRSDAIVLFTSDQHI